MHAEAEKREAAFASRREDLEKAYLERRQRLEEDAERRRREAEAVLAAERETLTSQLETRAKEVEAEKTRNGSWLAQREAEISERYQLNERALRQELNLAKIEYAAQYDERLRKLAEERESLRRDYEQKLRDLEKRKQG
ncbi:MAG: hypothetical protein A2V88_16095 [Elusimicrobia bacterium RBG_16_66_12]|nr:MAG: hypothetical protein A2V88_16095 [Elusimicrobia bacterium RBG_16_66_12]